MTRKKSNPLLVTANPLILTLCDTVNMPIHFIEGRLRGVKIASLNIGGMWRQNHDLILTSDQLSENAVSAFVRMAGDLWGYVVISGNGSATNRQSWLYLINGSGAKLRVGNLSTVITGTATLTLKMLSKHVVGSYTYDLGTDQWVEGAPAVWDAPVT